MAKGKLILICQSGGEFVTNDDGTMLYNGGEATAANVTSETPFNDLKLNLAETCNLDQETVSVKYFLPGNKRNLITLKNDKDVKRMIDFHGDAITAEVFVMGTPGFDRSALDMQTNRPSDIKNDETVKNNNTSTKKDETVKKGKVGTKKDNNKTPKSPSNASPAKRTRHAVAAAAAAAAAKAEPSSDEKNKGSTEDTSTSASSERVNENPDSDFSSDYIPNRYANRKKRKSETDINTSPADTVKKRRRTPSWKLGANGRPTIVDGSPRSKSHRKTGKAAGKATGGRKSRRKSGRLAAKDGSPETKSGRDQELDDPVDSLALVVCDDKEQLKLHGSHKESYNNLPWFSEKIIETNPGSITKLVIGDDKRFKSIFVAFYASLCGFQNSCRPIIFLESTSLRSEYGEVILTAIAIDGNDGFFPIAFAIVDVEDDNSWRYFLEQLKPAISNSQPITFIFDREKNLKKPVLEIYEKAHVGYSIYHLLESFKRNVKGPFHGDGKAFLPVHFLAAAHSVRLVGFRKAMEQIKHISSQAYDWVMQIEPENWTTSSFKGERYNHITDDIFESFSKLMDDNRELPILNKIDVIIHTMIDALNDAKLDVSMWSTQLTPLKEKELQEESLKSHGLKVLISSDTLFEVREDSTHVVNISNWSCTCLKWKETGLPCRHALAVFALTGRNVYEFCSNYFTIDAYRLTYNESITPVSIDDPKEGEKIETKKTGGENDKVEKEKTETEKGGGKNEEAAKTEGENENMETEKGGGENKEAAKTEGENETTEMEMEKGGGENEETGKNTEGKKGESEKTEVEKGRGEGEEAGKTEGEKDEKDEGGKCKIVEEDLNFFVLPPVPAKAIVEEKEKMEWEETEGETKRTVTCTKCKQPGHNKKSCNLYQVRQSLLT